MATLPWEQDWGGAQQPESKPPWEQDWGGQSSPIEPAPLDVPAIGESGASGWDRCWVAEPSQLRTPGS